ncbi:MAG TPA: hypothetical protein VF695_04205 [Sphingomonas sp.]|jgi:hypothetical protein
MLWAIVLALAGPSGAMTGDFDRDGRVDRVLVEKRGGQYNIMMYRSFGDVVPVEMNIPVTEDFKLRKVNRVDRVTACNFASLSRYACDAGDVLQFGSATQSAMAVWNGVRFIVFRPPVGQTAAK